jgi:two-component system, NtrC family, sensor kinase
MRPRSKAGGKPVKTRRRKTKAAHLDKSPAAREETEVVRLRRELDEALERQTATAKVLSVIASSPHDAQPVFDMIAKNAARLCKAQFCYVFRFDGELVHFAAQSGYASTPEVFLTGYPLPPGRTSAATRSILTGAIEQIPDVLADPDYGHGSQAKVLSFRSIVAVPMLKDGCPLGTIAITRSQAGKFPDWQIDLLRTFANQAMIAIENVRLFKAEQQRTLQSWELSESLENLRTAQDRLVQTEKLASLGQLTAGIAHEIKNPLNFVNNFSSVSVELIDELREALAGAQLDEKLRAEIGDLADTLQANLDKVVQHGKRADAIVKNMLLHSRQGSGEHRPVDVNALVEESLNLAYHGARAEKQDFNMTIERSFDPAAGEADLFPEEITRVLLNLISNGFYAATKRKTEANGGDYEPSVTAVTKNLGESVEIRIRDNGTGIPLEVKEKMFNPFFTTKPAGEGTGLGLSISHDIIVKQHGGLIEVDTQPGEFTEFRIVLPRTGASLIKSAERASH